MPAAQDWYVYILRCHDDTYYTGITTDVQRRVAEHNGLAPGRGAKYTQARRPVELAYYEVVASRAVASQREYALRTLSRDDKIDLCLGTK